MQRARRSPRPLQVFLGFAERAEAAGHEHTSSGSVLFDGRALPLYGDVSVLFPPLPPDDSEDGDESPAVRGSRLPRGARNTSLRRRVAIRSVLS